MGRERETNIHAQFHKRLSYTGKYLHPPMYVVDDGPARKKQRSGVQLTDHRVRVGAIMFVKIVAKMANGVRYRQHRCGI